MCSRGSSLLRGGERRPFNAVVGNLTVEWSVAERARGPPRPAPHRRL